MGVGTLNKIWLVFEKPFWDTNKTIFENLSPTANGKICDALYTKSLHPNHYTLLLFCGGEYSVQLEKKSSDEQLREILCELAVFFGCNIPNPIYHYISAWASDPYARGSYSAIAVGLYSFCFIFLLFVIHYVFRFWKKRFRYLRSTSR